jgi:inhibitor of cysteine peptidase
VPRPAIVDVSAGETRVALRPGQELVVRLRSNPSTGYGWTIARDAAAVLASAAPPAFEADPKAQGRVGAGGVETFRFTAVAIGREALRFEYRRSWEKHAAPASSAVVDVDVRVGGS